MERLTNKRLISMLFPVLKKAISDVPELDERDHYGHPAKWTAIDGFQVVYIQREDILTVSVTKHLAGKYDHATVSAIIKNGKVVGYGYSKEYRGLGNGFYAELDENGNIIRSEWD